MRNIFDLTKREQRLVIIIVVALVAVAFAKHLFESKSRPIPAGPPASPTSSVTTHAEEEQPDDSR